VNVIAIMIVIKLLIVIKKKLGFMNNKY